MARICDRFLEGSERAMKALTTAENPLTAPAAAALELRLSGALKWGARRRNSVKVNLMRQAELAAERWISTRPASIQPSGSMRN